MDIIFLHAPSVFDFRKEAIFFGPISDMVPSTPVFEMYPVGLASMSAYLEEHGMRARIVNLAYRMLASPRFDPAAMIRKLAAPVFGIDLHWLPHAQGSLEVARLVKEIHPKAKVLFGGLSASYFHRQLMDYPEVDLVLRGDSVEEPLRRLLAALRDGGDLAAVPNLTWRDTDGTVRENPLTHVPTDLDYTDFSYRSVMNQVFRHRDLRSVVPFQNWVSYPVTMPLLCRGCTENCVICGGSQYAFRNSFGRTELGVRSPARYVDNIVQLSRMAHTPVFLVGDIRVPGMAFADEVLDRLARAKVENEIVFEFFRGVDEPFMRKLAAAVPVFSMEMSPETHDERIRMASGKPYSTLDFENTIRLALQYGAKKVDIYYMVGIPRQDYASVMETVDYSRHLIRDIGHRRNVFPFISPLAPFLDPGSIAFEEPEKVGYKMRFRTLEEHRRALLAPSWKYTLSYETEWLNRDEIADATYEASLRLIDIRAEEGILDRKKAAVQRAKIADSRRIMAEIDAMVAADGVDRLKPGDIYRQRIDKKRVSALIDHQELMSILPGHGLRLRGLLGSYARWITGGRA